MILVERSAQVEAPIEVVWEVVQQAEQLPDWLAGVRQAEVLSGEGFGRRQRVQATRGEAVDAEVIAYQTPTLIGWRERAKGAGARAEARTEVYVQLAEDGDGTAVRLIVVRWGDGPVGKALRRWSTRRVGAGLEGSLERLTDLTAPAGRHAEPATPAELGLVDLLDPAEDDPAQADAEPTPADGAGESTTAATPRSGTARGVASARRKC
jgi:uncharacterized protein YndB with AHSA1/START domain